MKKFTFYLNVEALGETPKEAWDEAMEKLTAALMNGEYNDAPGQIFTMGKFEMPDEAVDALAYGHEIGIDHGEEPEVEEINAHGMPED